MSATDMRVLYALQGFGQQQGWPKEIQVIYVYYYVKRYLALCNRILVFHAIVL